MTRKIDFSQPLDADEEQYVKDRPWLIQDAELQGLEVRFESEEDSTLDLDDDAAGAADEDESNDDGTGADESGEDEPQEDESGDDETDDETDEGGEEDESTDEVAPYAEWDYADLKTEAGTRGLKQNGSKEQLIERLEENDASAPE